MVGNCGINPNDFDFLTPHESSLIYNAWVEREKNMMIDHWQRIRWQTTCLINIQLKRGKQKAPDKMFPFTWEQDPEQTKKISTREDFERLKNKYSDAK